MVGRHRISIEFRIGRKIYKMYLKGSVRFQINAIDGVEESHETKVVRDVFEQRSTLAIS